VSLVLAMLAASVVSVLFAVMVIWLRVNQVIAGLALVFFCQGLTALVGSTADWTNHATGGIGAMALWPLSLLPGRGPARCEQNAMVWLTLPIFGAVAWFFARTSTGLRLRAVGENPQAADAAGIRVTAWRFAAVLAGSALVGLAGAYISVVSTKLWIAGMTGGRGWIAVGLVIFARWSPWKALVGAVLFGLHRGADSAAGRGRRAAAAVLRDDDAVRGDARRDGVGRAGDGAAATTSPARWANPMCGKNADERNESLGLQRGARARRGAVRRLPEPRHHRGRVHRHAPRPPGRRAPTAPARRRGRATWWRPSTASMTRCARWACASCTSSRCCGPAAWTTSRGIPAAWRRYLPACTWARFRMPTRTPSKARSWTEWVTRVEPGDMRVDTKRRLSAFYPTDLDFLLRNQRIETVVLDGGFTDCCVLNTGLRRQQPQLPRDRAARPGARHRRAPGGRGARRWCRCTWGWCSTRRSCCASGASAVTGR
jgi:hypothetical protein